MMQLRILDPQAEKLEKTQAPTFLIVFEEWSNNVATCRCMPACIIWKIYSSLAKDICPTMR